MCIYYTHINDSPVRNSAGAEIGISFCLARSKTFKISYLWIAPAFHNTAQYREHSLDIMVDARWAWRFLITIPPWCGEEQDILHTKIKLFWTTSVETGEDAHPGVDGSRS